MTGRELTPARQRAIAGAHADPPLPEPDGPVDPSVAASPIEEASRPGRFTLMAAGWMPPTHLVTQALGLCFTADGLVVMVTWDGRQWSFPGGTVEDGESVEQALVREVAEEACARVVRCQYLASQHVADPLNPDGRPSYYQSRWWARVELDPWQPQDEMIARRLVPPRPGPGHPVVAAQGNRPPTAPPCAGRGPGRPRPVSRADPGCLLHEAR
jgi:ADP-ribose pyrophosphatase YjhB (NUDIX family)